MSTYPSSVMRDGFANYERSRSRGEFTDLSFTNGSGNINAHRIIVCSQSDVFYKACLGGFRVSAISRVGFLTHSVI
jgi:hypothetical protein